MQPRGSCNDIAHFVVALKLFHVFEKCYLGECLCLACNYRLVVLWVFVNYLHIRGPH